MSEVISIFHNSEQAKLHMAESEYESTTLPESEFAFRLYQFVFQEIKFNHEDKQTRASLTMPESGGKYIYTVAIDDVWENAHFHRNQTETYILESGEAVLITMVGNRARAQRLTAGAAVTLTADTHHKVWMRKGAKLHAVKAAAQTTKNLGFKRSRKLERLCDAVGLEILLQSCADHPFE